MKSRSIAAPNLLALRILGIFPTSTRRRNGSFTFSWLSLWTVYAVLLYVGTCVISVLVAKPKIDVLYSGDEYGRVRSYYTLAIIWPNILLPILGLLSSRSLAAYLNQWKIVEEEFFAVTGKPLRFSRLKIVSLAIACCIVIEPTTTLLWRFIVDRFTILEALVHVQSHLVFNSLLAMWHCQSTLVACAFAKLSDDLATTLLSWREADALLVERYKFLYSRIASLTADFCESMNLLIATSCLGLYIDMIIAAYAIIVELSANEPSLSLIFRLIFPLLYCGATLQITCEIGERFAAAGGSQFAEEISALTPRHDFNSRAEFLRLMDTVYFRSPRSRLVGCVKLDRGLTVNGLSIMFGYMVILFQFNQGL